MWLLYCWAGAYPVFQYLEEFLWKVMPCRLLECCQCATTSAMISSSFTILVYKIAWCHHLQLHACILKILNGNH